VSVASDGDPHDLERFVQAQAGTYDQALSEVRSGRKQSHWMWFVFPQLEGLGYSAMSKRYAIRSLGEARAYLNHPVLGARLREIADAALCIEGKSAREVFGSPDDVKLQSCATLFAHVSPDKSVFHALLDRYFDGERSAQTMDLLVRAGS
jgi:uncharacterized protein (DUF1810 family)